MSSPFIWDQLVFSVDMISTGWIFYCALHKEREGLSELININLLKQGGGGLDYYFKSFSKQHIIVPLKNFLEYHLLNSVGG